MIRLAEIDFKWVSMGIEASYSGRGTVRMNTSKESDYDDDMEKLVERAIIQVKKNGMMGRSVSVNPITSIKYL